MLSKKIDNKKKTRDYPRVKDKLVIFQFKDPSGIR